MIKIKSVLAIFGSEKQFKVEKKLISVQQKLIDFWQTHPFSMKIRLNFFKLNKTPWDKNIKRDSVSAYVHMRCDTLVPLYAPVHIVHTCKHFWLTSTPPPPSRAPHVPSIISLDGLFPNQKTNTNIRISYSLKYSIRKKHSGEPC